MHVMAAKGLQVLIILADMIETKFRYPKMLLVTPNPRHANI